MIPYIHLNYFTPKAYRLAVEDTLLNLADEKPAKVAHALIANPDLFRELEPDMAKAILLTLIDRGQADSLRQLLGLKATGRRKATLLAELLLKHAIQQH